MSGFENSKSASRIGWLSFLFLISGFAALIYQMVWQRVLLTAFGVNIESVTIVVSVFMLGLGIGSLVGGVLSKRFASHLPLLFLLCEVIVGLFGIFSLPLMRTVSDATVRLSLPLITLITYLILSIPTLFMGATLPILVAHLDRYYRSVSTSLVRLYFLNTLGSAIACFVTADILFSYLGQQAVVLMAASCNLTVGFLVFRYLRTVGIDSERAGMLEESVSDVPGEHLDAGRRRTRFAIILFLACGVGYLSLSQEIIWFRVLSYATGGRPDVFPHVVGFLLLGIAYGARDTRKFYKNDRNASLAFIATALSFSSLLFYFSAPVSAELLTFLGFLGIYSSYLAILLAAFITGGIFPALCHYGVESGTAVGLSLSFVYGANITGSTAGPLLTGFLFLERHTLDRLILYLSMGGFFLAALVWAAAPVSKRVKLSVLAGIGCLVVGILTMHDTVYAQLLEKLHYKTEYADKGPYKYVVENRNGIVAVEAAADDIVYGGAVYDGTFNIDPVSNSNHITRAYMVAALHKNPEDVLEIGLSSGSWARVVASHRAVKSLTIIEINPAYAKLLQHYPDAAALLRDPKITVHYDDGRRWLRRNPGRRFDVILMNATFHWRDMSTNLLSDEFLRLCKSHLKEGGMVYYNSTWSEDVVFTAAQVFRHVVTCMNFVAASDQAFSLTENEKRLNLLGFEGFGKRVVAGSDPAARRVLEELVADETTDRGNEIRSLKGLWHITDDNMAPEFKHRVPVVRSK